MNYLINISSSSLSDHIEHWPSHSRNSWSFFNFLIFLLGSISLYFLEVFCFYKSEVLVQVQDVRWLDKDISWREICLSGKWLYSLIPIIILVVLSVSNEEKTFLIVLELDFLAYFFNEIPTYESIEVSDED